MVSVLERDDGLAVVREIVTGLRAVCGDVVPAEAVANWTNRERAAVVAWLRQIAAAGGDRVADPPAWLVSMRLVHGALSPDKAAAAAWSAMRDHGAGDAVLHSQVAAILSSRFVTGFADGWGECCWRIDSRRRASVWFGAIVPPDFAADEVWEFSSLPAAVDSLAMWVERFQAVAAEGPLGGVRTAVTIHGGEG